VTAEQLAASVVDLVQTTDNVSFAELSNRWPEHFRNGPLQYMVGDGIVVWVGLSDVAADALDIIRAGKTINLKPSSTLVYLADGVVLQLPIAKKARKYKHPHWLPTVLCRRKP
jgi:hypothetical protein